MPRKTPHVIPSGFYHGDIKIPERGIFHITAPVGGDGYGGLPELVLTTDQTTSSYNIVPYTYTCLGNELVLEWKGSEPPSQGYITAYYQEGNGLTAIGHFADNSWGGASKKAVFPIFHLYKKSREREPLQ